MGSVLFYGAVTLALIYGLGKYWRWLKRWP